MNNVNKISLELVLSLKGLKSEFSIREAKIALLKYIL